MHFLATPFTFLEITVFVIALVAFVLAIRFFIASQKKLEGLLPNRKAKRAYFGIDIDRDGFLVPANRQKPVKAERSESFANEETKQEIKELRQMLQLQQLELGRALRQLEDLNLTRPTADDDTLYQDEDSEADLSHETLVAEELRQRLVGKEADLRELRQQLELSQQLQAHVEDVQSRYDDLQQKVQTMEGQAWEAAEVTIKLESLQLEIEQLEKKLHTKEERLRVLTAENSRLREQLVQTEDKLSETNLQRQQLVKRLRFLEDVNTDIQQMGDTNRKLKTELRRVGELESMLNLITEERDALLSRKRR